MSISSPATFISAISRSCAALAVAESVVLVQLARLGVDQPRRERSGVAAEQRVGQRAVAPEEPGEVQAHQQLGERVEQRLPQARQRHPAEQGPVRQRVLEVLGDHRVVEALAVVAGPAGGHADRLDHGHAALFEGAQQPVLARGQLAGQLLDGVDVAARRRRSARRGGGCRAPARRGSRTSTARAGGATAGRARQGGDRWESVGGARESPRKNRKTQNAPGALRPEASSPGVRAGVGEHVLDG